MQRRSEPSQWARHVDEAVQKPLTTTTTTTTATNTTTAETPVPDADGWRRPKHQRVLSASDASQGAPQRRRLCSDEEYISLLNSNAFDFRPSPCVVPSPPSVRPMGRRSRTDPPCSFRRSSSRDRSRVLHRPDGPRTRAQERRVQTDPLTPPPALSLTTMTTTSHRRRWPFVPQHPAPSHLTTINQQAPELDTSSASVTPVSPKTPPFVGLRSTPEVKPKSLVVLPHSLSSTSNMPVAQVVEALRQHGFAYVEEVQSIICLHCPKPRILYRGILRSHLRKHVEESTFQAVVCELEHLVAQLPAFAKSIEEVPRRQCGRPALPYLPVLQGFRCLLCDFCAVSSRYVDNHWGEKHKGASRPATLYAPASLQTLGGSRQLTRLFWVVP